MSIPDQISPALDDGNFSDSGSGEDLPPEHGSFAAVSPAENQQHLNAASVEAAQRVGIDLNARGSWTQRQAIEYIATFKGIILANPWMFNTLSLQIAEGINLDRPGYDLERDGDKLIDPNAAVLLVTDIVAWSADQVKQTYGGALSAVEETATGFVDALGGFGRSLSSLGALAPVLIVGSAIAFLYFAVQSTGRDPGGQFGKFAGATSGAIRPFIA